MDMIKMSESIGGSAYDRYMKWLESRGLSKFF